MWRDEIDVRCTRCRAHAYHDADLYYALLHGGAVAQPYLCRGCRSVRQTSVRRMSAIAQALADDPFSLPGL